LAAQTGHALAPPRLAIAGYGVFHQPDSFSFRVSFSIEIHF
jgi:hypothetical protein